MFTILCQKTSSLLSTHVPVMHSYLYTFVHGDLVDLE